MSDRVAESNEFVMGLGLGLCIILVSLLALWTTKQCLYFYHFNRSRHSTPPGIYLVCCSQRTIPDIRSKRINLSGVQ
jgi:hypothetical protein